MAGVTITHWLTCPVRYQPHFEEGHLDDCAEDHRLFALPGSASLWANAETGEPAGAAAAATAAQSDRQGKWTEPAFQVLLDVTQFRPEDVIIQVFEGWLLVKAQHPSRMDEHGFVSRSFTRQYKLPEKLKAGDLRAMLCHDGILVVESNGLAPGDQ
ncbi:heat shock protein beta-3 [Conger conger]|uniref:heat shock protein beta-3 n=1 Tax=Conger conger TaxID=82655 RepID=UPI002A5A27B5|nr:heat shock protein beta-3 [Conger conger]